MAFVVENGQGLADAQSLASVAELRAYATETGVKLSTRDSDCEVLLIKAMRRMFGFNYQGVQVRRDQALPWPRLGIEVEGYYYDSSIIPKRVKNAQCAYAIAALTFDLQPIVKANTKGTTVSETIGPISRSFADTGRILDAPRVPEAEKLLAPFVLGIDSIKLVRS